MSGRNVLYCTSALPIRARMYIQNKIFIRISTFSASSISKLLLKKSFASGSKNSKALIQIPDLSPSNFKYEVVHSGSKELPPRLAHGLESILFSPGQIFRLQDPITKKFNFSPFLKKLHSPDQFNFSLLNPHMPPASDPTLQLIAERAKARYYSSTSSFTSILAYLYLLMSGHRPVDISYFSQGLKDGHSSRSFTKSSSKPTCYLLLWKGEEAGYAINKEKLVPDVKGTVMSFMGLSLEKMLVEEPENFAKYLHSYKGVVSKADLDQPEAYSYGTAEGFLIRSQLDCMHPDLPRKSFDLKTRATLPIRNDPYSYKDYANYRLIFDNGKFNSYEREYYDLLRSKMLLNSLQARCGMMDGIFVAHHNTQEMFGFQYVPLKQMEQHVYGSTVLAEASFALSMRILRRVLDAILEPRRGRSVRLTLCLHAENLSIFVEEVEADANNYAVTSPGTNPVEKYVLSVSSKLNREEVDSVRSLSSSDLWQVSVKVTASENWDPSEYTKAIESVKESEMFGSSEELGNKAFSKGIMEFRQ